MSSPIPAAPIAVPTLLSHAPSKSRDKLTVVNGLAALRGALASKYAAGASIELPSGTFTVPELTEEIDAYLAAVAEVTAAKQAFHAAVEKERKLRVAPSAHRAELQAVVAARVGKHATEMAAYGFTPEKVRVVSPQAKLAGAIKAKATRVARGTMGRKQKLAIRGNVTHVLLSAVTHGAPPANAPSPTFAPTVEHALANKGDTENED